MTNLNWYKKNVFQKTKSKSGLTITECTAFTLVTYGRVRFSRQDWIFISFPTTFLKKIHEKIHKNQGSCKGEMLRIFIYSDR